MQTIPNLSQMARVAILVDANAPLAIEPEPRLYCGPPLVKENVLEQDIRHWGRRAHRGGGRRGAGRKRVHSRVADSDERVDISDPKSIAALFERIGELDGIVCTGGAARYKPWDQLTDEDWTFSLANKLMGQVNVVRYGLKSVRPGGAITLTTGLASQYPSPAARSSPPSTRRSSFCARGSREPSISIRVNAVSPGWVSETLQAMGRDPADGISAAEVAKIIVRQFREGATGSVAPGPVKV